MVYDDVYDAKAAVDQLSGFNVAGRFASTHYLLTLWALPHHCLLTPFHCLLTVLPLSPHFLLTASPLSPTPKLALCECQSASQGPQLLLLPQLHLLLLLRRYLVVLYYNPTKAQQRRDAMAAKETIERLRANNYQPPK